MDPGWLLLFILLVTEAAALSILILPMPNNTIRGWVLNFFSKTWAGSNILRYMTFFLLLLNVLYFGSSMSSIYSVEAFDLQTCEAKLDYFRHERNSYITGFGLFLFVVLQRIVMIQTQLHDTRDKVKAINKKN
uniref:Endoplasmic reticulum transmembrane protein n=1 Tax=Hemiselmis andersenii TaxID=464988 RepID=A0A6U4KA63_HEMAN|mmetsp:Transcript_26164/g.63448  ORF Transcript_26164/g.63448 Transcript_26164/m.63448 type:complete len:133 (+) Transcript_26164:176-574(+)